GIALIQGEKVVWGAELTHRGQEIKASLESKAALLKQFCIQIQSKGLGLTLHALNQKVKNSTH
ncbi:MAG: hypothetical protein ACKPH7_31415, partial [Planktothrix sp.]|uniref:hypothetical protein n=1 Tax=Planktothrix sp. TaxID=3088171 RepID=UPI0038D47F7F